MTEQGNPSARAPCRTCSVSTAEREAPALILLDLTLPAVDGWAAARRLKAHERTRRIPVIALTAHAMAGDREKALAAGCDDFLVVALLRA